MKKLLLLALAPLILAGCGSTTATVFTVTTGYYGVAQDATGTSGAYTAGGYTGDFSTDDCNWVPSFKASLGAFDYPWTFASDSKSGSIVFASPDDLGNKPVGSDILVALDGNAITTTSAASYDTALSSTCVYTNTVRIVSGELIGNDDLHLVAERLSVPKAGAICTGVTLLTKRLPCGSRIDFTARKGT